MVYPTSHHLGVTTGGLGPRNTIWCTPTNHHHGVMTGGQGLRNTIWCPPTNHHLGVTTGGFGPRNTIWCPPTDGIDQCLKFLLFRHETSPSYFIRRHTLTNLEVGHIQYLTGNSASGRPWLPGVATKGLLTHILVNKKYK